MSEEQTSQVTDKDRQAVKRLQEYFRRRAWDLKIGLITDETFTRWLGDVLKNIRQEEYQRVKTILENDPAFAKRKEKTK